MRSGAHRLLQRFTSFGALGGFENLVEILELTFAFHLVDQIIQV